MERCRCTQAEMPSPFPCQLESHIVEPNMQSSSLDHCHHRCDRAVCCQAYILPECCQHLMPKLWPRMSDGRFWQHCRCASYMKTVKFFGIIAHVATGHGASSNPRWGHNQSPKLEIPKHNSRRASKLAPILLKDTASMNVISIP
jgi:hypothetical protein